MQFDMLVNCWWGQGGLKDAYEKLSLTNLI